MRLPRIFVDQELTVGGALELPASAANHVGRVLRKSTGDPLVLFNDRDGRDYQAKVLTIGKKNVSVKIVEAGPAADKPALAIHLAIGISKGERMDFAIQKAVELGVTSITPLMTERTNVRLPADRLARKVRHWQAVITSACEQSGQAWLTELRQVVTLREWLKAAPPNSLLLDPDADMALPQWPAPVGSVYLLVGPEGGLSEQEKVLAYQAGCTGIRLGPRILRTETAPLAAVAAIQVLWGDYSAS